MSTELNSLPQVSTIPEYQTLKTPEELRPLNLSDVTEEFLKITEPKVQSSETGFKSIRNQFCNYLTSRISITKAAKKINGESEIKKMEELINVLNSDMPDSDALSLLINYDDRFFSYISPETTGYEKLFLEKAINNPKILQRIPKKILKNNISLIAKIIDQCENKSELTSIGDASLLGMDGVRVLVTYCIEKNSKGMLIHNDGLVKNTDFTDLLFKKSIESKNTEMLLMLSKNKSYLKNLEADTENYPSFALSFVESNPNEFDKVNKATRTNPKFLFGAIKISPSIFKEVTEDTYGNKCITELADLFQLEGKLNCQILKQNIDIAKLFLARWLYMGIQPGVDNIHIVAREFPELFKGIKTLNNKLNFLFLEAIKENPAVLRYVEWGNIDKDTFKSMIKGNLQVINYISELDITNEILEYTVDLLIYNEYELDKINSSKVLNRYIDKMNERGLRIPIHQLLTAHKKVTREDDYRLAGEKTDWNRIYLRCVENHPDNFRFLDNGDIKDNLASNKDFIESCLKACYAHTKGKNPRYTELDILLFKSIPNIKKQDVFIIDLAKLGLFKKRDLTEIDIHDMTLLNKLLPILKNNGDDVDINPCTLEDVRNNIKKYQDEPYLLANMNPPPFDINKRADKQLAIEIVKANGTAIAFMGKSILNNKEVALEAVKQNGIAYRFLGESLKKEHAIAICAVTQTEEAYPFFDENSLKRNPDFLLKVVTAKPEAIQYFGHRLFKEFNEDKKGPFTKAGVIPGILDVAFVRLGDVAVNLLFSRFKEKEYVEFIGKQSGCIQGSFSYQIESEMYKKNDSGNDDENEKNNSQHHTKNLRSQAGTLKNLFEESMLNIVLFKQTLLDILDKDKNINNSMLKNVIQNMKSDDFDKLFGRLINKNNRTVDNNEPFLQLIKELILCIPIRDGYEPILTSWITSFNSARLAYGNKKIASTEQKIEDNLQSLQGIKYIINSENGKPTISLALLIQREKEINKKLSIEKPEFDKLPKEGQRELVRQTLLNEIQKESGHNADVKLFEKLYSEYEAANTLKKEVHLDEKRTNEIIAFVTGKISHEEYLQQSIKVAKSLGYNDMVERYEDALVIEKHSANNQKDEKPTNDKLDIQNKPKENVPFSIASPDNINQAALAFQKSSFEFINIKYNNQDFEIKKENNGKISISNKDDNIVFKGIDPDKAKNVCETFKFLEETGLSALGNEGIEAIFRGINSKPGLPEQYKFNPTDGLDTNEQIELLGIIKNITDSKDDNSSNPKLSDLIKEFKTSDPKKDMINRFRKVRRNTLHIDNNKDGGTELLKDEKINADTLRSVVAQISVDTLKHFSEGTKDGTKSA